MEMQSTEHAWGVGADVRMCGGGPASVAFALHLHLILTQFMKSPVHLHLQALFFFFFFSSSPPPPSPGSLSCPDSVLLHSAWTLGVGGRNTVESVVCVRFATENLGQI